jgi:hypothetical protein
MSVDSVRAFAAPRAPDPQETSSLSALPAYEQTDEMNGAPTDNVPTEGGGDANAYASAQGAMMAGLQAEGEGEANDAASATPDFIRVVSSGSSDTGKGGTRAPPQPLVGIVKPHETNDVLCGRGGKSNNHKGNRRLRELIRSHHPMYEAAAKLEKKGVATAVVGMWRAQDPQGRILEYDETSRTWRDVGNSEAAEKVCQKFRELTKATKGGATKHGDQADPFEPIVRLVASRTGRWIEAPHTSHFPFYLQPVGGASDVVIQIDLYSQSVLYLATHSRPEQVAGVSGCRLESSRYCVPSILVAKPPNPFSTTMFHFSRFQATTATASWVRVVKIRNARARAGSGRGWAHAGMNTISAKTTRSSRWRNGASANGMPPVGGSSNKRNFPLEPPEASSLWSETRTPVQRSRTSWATTGSLRLMKTTSCSEEESKLISIPATSASGACCRKASPSTTTFRAIKGDRALRDMSRTGSAGVVGSCGKMSSSAYGTRPKNPLSAERSKPT